MMKVLFLTLLIMFFSCKGTSQEKIENTIIKNNNINHVKELNISKEEFENTTIPISDFDKINYDYYSLTKQGNKLEIDLNNGKKILFEDNEGTPYDENVKTYNLITDFKELDKYLIKLSEYEDTQYLLLDKNNGIIDSLQGIPFLSPDKNNIFSMYYNQYEEPFTQEIFIYEINRNHLSLFFKKDYPNYEILSFYWKDDNTINIKFRRDNKYFFKSLIINE